MALGEDRSSADRLTVMPVRIIADIGFFAAFVWVFFTLAGRWDWVAGWVYLGMLFGGALINVLLLWNFNPELLKRRLQFGFGAGTKSWDVICLAAFGLTYLLIVLVGVLDAGRNHWLVMPAWLWLVGAVFFVAGSALINTSMLANPFFEKTARIQNDRNHHVIDSGPYRYVRHPGYVGVIAGFILAAPFMLGSWWALVPAILSVVSIVVRTALEDHMLLDELDGYKAYASRVRYRLVPYLW
jgi:protein-S-isoprenylcysteine O-methyltransferase Ste14